MNKKLWKICYSNARAAVRANGSKPQKIYPYCGCEHVSPERQKIQKYWNDCAKWTLEFTQQAGFNIQHNPPIKRKPFRATVNFTPVCSYQFKLFVQRLFHKQHIECPGNLQYF